ncbi:Serine/Threonine protein kinase [Sulfitobacter noctilucae]|uniref:DUF4384 domain-containing protein n=1 Tax=Sulfitobacter noctilucae TaxID=1342302 RepID=UPI00046A3974|nr:DUF4384 domain-containing protein [Sulfitobacter noctilucae]KIN70285.1 Serine/Threonine protein kinase [Sulfitobacter noctilucae]
MKNPAGIWALGLVVSMLVHLGAAVGLRAALQPEEVQDQQMPESRLSVQAQDVTRSSAAEKAPVSEATKPQEADGASLNAGAIAQSSAASVAPQVQSAAVQDPQAATQGVSAAEVKPMSQTAAAPVADRVPQRPPRTDQVTPVPPPKTDASEMPPTAAEAEAAQVQPIAVASLNPPSVNTAPRTPETQSTPSRTPKATASKAVLAFPADGAVDPVSLAAFQSFTAPQQTDSDNVRDSLTAALSVPCSRMQVTFDPVTTSLQVSGHVPSPDQRAPVLQALRAQMGADIDVTENLLILPAPQCGALTRIAEVGLPQSTDQITNPLIVGADTHARAFRFVKDRPLVIEMGGPDYAAYIYVDYFDADGNVIHLSPNDSAPLRQIAPKEEIVIGARGPDDPGLFVLVGPPYGQEIAAAFAASEPLYEGNRPVVEPAAPYLAWLRGQVAQARDTHPDFKGEWVYFFVTTAEK